MQSANMFIVRQRQARHHAIPASMAAPVVAAGLFAAAPNISTSWASTRPMTVTAIRPSLCARHADGGPAGRAAPAAPTRDGRYPAIRHPDRRSTSTPARSPGSTSPSQPMYGGVLATASDLVFAGEMNGDFNAFDAKTGEEAVALSSGRRRSARRPSPIASRACSMSRWARRAATIPPAC